MPGVDWIPGVSQLKTVCQLVTGDTKGAKETMENFAKECPVVSLVTSGAQLLDGDYAGALETQKRSLGTISNVTNGIPVVGHIKGGVQHALGYHEYGNQALQAATRSSVVLGSGVVAGMASGGLAAIPTAIAAGSAYDIADSAISDKPKGVCAVVKNAIDNPNAGNIFDATAVFVGDGLAGYSGGQIGKQISTNIKLNSLDAARAAKYDKLDAAMFPEKGSASAMTSGQLNILGQEISAITSEMHSLQYGTPKYWFDPKNNQIVIQRSTGGAPAFVGNVSADDVENIRRTYGFPIECLPDDFTDDIGPESGVDVDHYDGEIEVPLSPEEKRVKQQEYVEQKPEPTKTLRESIPKKTTIIQDREQLGKKLNDNNPRKNPTKEQVDLLNQLVWLHVPMPDAFDYTGGIVVNNSFRGLLHTFARHWDQWEKYIPGLRELINNLPADIRLLLEEVKNAKDKKTSTAALKKLNAAIVKIQYNTNIIADLLEIQIKVHDFMIKNVTSAHYLEDGMNGNGQIQVYFKVTQSNGVEGVMVLCVSNELYPSIDEFHDIESRPVRSIITVFFQTKEEFENNAADFHIGQSFDNSLAKFLEFLDNAQ